MQIQTIKMGSVLISRPSLLMDVFYCSVVIITEHTGNGTVGFVVNKPTDRFISDYIFELNVDFPVYKGGPVDQDNIYYLHKRPDLISDSRCVQDDLYWSGNFSDIKYAINSGYLDSSEIRFYLGYSGWSKKQLKSEIEGNSWRMADDRVDIFQNYSGNLWREEMRKLGGESFLWMNMPRDPIMN